MSENAAPQPATEIPVIAQAQDGSISAPTTDTMTSEPAPQPITQDTDRTPSADQKTKKSSGFGGLLKEFKKALPTSNKSSNKNQSMSATNSPVAAAAGTTTTPSYSAGDPHPGTIISDQSHTAGNQAVVPQPVHRKGGVLGSVDMLVTKEAEKVMQAMANMVENSGGGTATGDVPLGPRDTIYPPEGQSHTQARPSHGWMSNWEETQLDKLFTSHRMGNYVIVDRQTKAKIFESMPVFTRLGMHLLFVSTTHEFLDLKAVEKLFADLSIRQGKMYDNTDPTFFIPHIQSFVKTYSIPTDQLLEPDFSKYKNFNAFFSRQLKPSARPVTDPEDLSVLTSPADSRLTVFQSIDAAKKFWIKGKEFNLVNLLDDSGLAEKFGANPSIAVFRLAPQDYHRFHSPFRATLGKRSSIHGTYYTVNPQAVNENLNVFTANHRDIQVMNVFTSVPASSNATAAAPAPTNIEPADVQPPAPTTADTTNLTTTADANTIPFALVAVGAMLVGSIGWSKCGGQEVQKGEDLGFFQYGGSTTILVAPEGKVQWDADLVEESEKPVETLVRVGERIGKINL